MARYNLDNELDRLSYQIRSDKLLKARKQVELTDKSKRSIKQNSYLHLIIAFFAMETFNTADFVKINYYKLEANRDMFFSFKMEFGKKRAIIRGSRTLTVEEMSLSIDRFKDWSAQVAGIPLPEPEQLKILEDIEKKAANLKQYL